MKSNKILISKVVNNKLDKIRPLTPVVLYKNEDKKKVNYNQNKYYIQKNHYEQNNYLNTINTPVINKEDNFIIATSKLLIILIKFLFFSIKMSVYSLFNAFHISKKRYSKKKHFYNKFKEV